MSNNWFRKTTEEIVNTLGTTIEHGLAADIAAKRLLELGPNQLAEGEKQSSLLLLLEQFKNPLLIILLVGAAISFYAGHAVDAVAQCWSAGVRTVMITGDHAVTARASDESFFVDNLGARIVLRGLALGGLSYFMFDFALDRGATLAYAETLAFSTLIFSQLWHIFDARTFSTVYHRNPFTNKYLLLAVGLSALLSIAVIYLPVGNTVFGTEPLQPLHLLMVVSIAALPTFVLSAIKRLLV